MSNQEEATYTPPGADAAANKPLLQPWNQRHEVMSRIKDLLGSRDSENPLLQQHTNDSLLVGRTYTEEQFSQLFAIDNWEQKLASGEDSFGFEVDGFSTTLSDRNEIAKRVAQGIKYLRQISGVEAKFKDSPKWQQNIFKELVMNAIVAQNAVHTAGLFEPSKIAELTLATQEAYLTHWHVQLAGKPLSIDNLSPEQVRAVAYGIQAVEYCNTTRLDWLGPDSGLYKQINPNNQEQLTNIISTNGSLFVPTMINAPHELVKLHDTIIRSPHIRLGYQAPVAEAPAQAVTSGESGGTGEARDDGETPLIQQAEDEVALADRDVTTIEAEISAARAALEALESRRIEAIQRRESAQSTRTNAQNLELLKAEAAKREALLKGFDEDPDVREGQIKAATLIRPENEGPGFADLEYFMNHVISLSVEQIATIYEIEPSQFESNYNKFQTLMETVKNGIDFSMLRDPLITLFDRVVEDIGHENLQRGRQKLESAIQAHEGTDNLEDRVRDGLAHLRQIRG